jgi:hypothetical protein
VQKQVPAAVIADALANPAKYRDWMKPLDPGKPPSPANPYCHCLSLMNINAPYHPTYNPPVWRPGCYW